MPSAFRFEAEVRLLRWGESSTAGRTITLELPPDAGEAHPFKGFPTGHKDGQRFRMRFDVIRDDDTVGGKFADCSKGPKSAPNTNNTPSPREATKPKRDWSMLQRSQQAGILINEPAFWRWLFTHHRSAKWDQIASSTDADRTLKRTLGIESKRDLNRDDPVLIARFDELVQAYRRDQNTPPLSAYEEFR